MKRVVITGMRIISPIGIHRDEVWENLIRQKTGIVSMPEWEKVKDLKVSIAGSCKDYDSKRINRRDRRTMGAMSIMAALATLDALEQAAIPPETVQQSYRLGLAMGSTTGSGTVIQAIFNDFLNTGGISRLEGTAFMKIMNHSVAANLAAMLGVKGRVISPCSACASSTQAIGLGYETIKDGYQEIMICGGADELHPTTAGVFDVLNAASRQKTGPSPRPFDKNRDGLVVGEGAGALILESLDHAQKRNARILGEIIGYHTTCDGAHMTSPQHQGMLRSMTGALESAGLAIRDIDYINAHATGTRLGDAAESRAIGMLGVHNTPVSATKGYTGHTLAANGVMESIFCLMMMENNMIIPTRNLNEIDSDCDSITHVIRPVNTPLNTVMTSNFAFGGINATLILKKYI
jgi:3-oxoacyl-[acyl-carrier-protein] synthase II